MAPLRGSSIDEVDLSSYTDDLLRTCEQPCGFVVRRVILGRNGEASEYVFALGSEDDAFQMDRVWQFDVIE